MEDKAYKQCLCILNKMNEGDRVKISDVAPKHPQLFIDCVKRAIDEGHEYEFNHDYTIVKNISYKF